MSDRDAVRQDGPMPVAIVGMACRFPGAEGIERFWQNLVDGVDAVTRFDELDREIPGGIPESKADGPLRVLANGVLDGIEGFDCNLFGFSHGETAVTDPQQRVALEVAWQCLLDAGCASDHKPGHEPGDVGVFTSASHSTYLVNQLLPDVERALALGGMPLLLRNDKDHLATLIAYKFGLRGPALNVGCGCSGGLAAVHLGVQNLLTWQCDVALCGAASILVPQRQGHLRQVNSIYSDDGICRVFDDAATGTVGSSGVGFVALKRLDDAIAAGDTVRAVILGSAVNNDGRAKAGYTAPSVDRQAAAVASAHAVAGIDAGSVTMVEAHGTGTALGDPVEVEALARGFRKTTDAVGFCALGSVKSAIGHLDTASGLAGLIKAALALERAVIPPTLHFTRANRHLELEGSPFYVNTQASPWRTPDGMRRAGVSALGMGGTNVHVVLEAAPPEAAAALLERDCHLFALSAHDGSSLREFARRLAEMMAGPKAPPLGTVARSLVAGRPEFAHRAVAVAGTTAELASELGCLDHSESAGAAVRPVTLVLDGSRPEAAAGILDRLGREPGWLQEYDRLLARMAVVSAGPVAAGVRFAISLWAFGAWMTRTVPSPAALVATQWGVPGALALSGAVDEDEAVRMLADAADVGWEALGRAYLDPLADRLLMPVCLDGTWLGIAVDGPLQELSAPGSAAQLRVLLNRLGAIWCSGGQIDWDALHGGWRLRRCRLPDYAFTRARCWFEPQVRRALPPIERVLPALACRHAARMAADPLVPITQQTELAEGLDAICVAAARRLVARALPAGEVASAHEIARRIGVHARWRRFLDALLQLLVERGTVRVEECGFRFDAVGAAGMPGEVDPAGLALCHPDFADLISLVTEFAGRLDAYLRDPVAGPTAFAGILRDGRLGKALGQSRTPFSFMDACCRISAELTEHLVRRAGTLRILEVGAGGLILTGFMEPLLGDDRIEYHVTDIDPAVVERARRTLDERGLPHVTTAVLDITRELAAQGVDDASVDLILALNVLHVCPDVEQAFGNLRRALRPSGCLVALETVNCSAWQTFLWGWADGWWNFADSRRTICPLLDRTEWKSLAAAFEPSALALLPEDTGADTVAIITQFAQPAAPREAGDLLSGLPPKEPDRDRWLYRPVLLREPVAALPKSPRTPAFWILLDSGTPADEALARRLGRSGKVIRIAATDSASGTDQFRADREEDFARLLDRLAPDMPPEVGVVHSVTLGSAPDAVAARDRGIHSLLALARGLGDGRGRQWHVVCLTRGVLDPGGDELLEPENALLQAAVKIIPREFPFVQCRLIDVADAPDAGNDAAWAPLEHLATSPQTPEISAWRGRNFWRWDYRRIAVAGPAPAPGGTTIRDGGTYVIFGGLGGIGQAVAARLARDYRANLLLVGRSADPDEPAVARRLRDLEHHGGTVLAMRADVTEADEVAVALKFARQRFGDLNGVIHSAGVVDKGGVILGRSRDQLDAAIASKTIGAANIVAALENHQPDFLVFFSSIGSLLYKLKFGEIGYVAGNDFLDVLARRQAATGPYVTKVVHWSDWATSGMWARSRRQLRNAYRTAATGNGGLLDADLLQAMTDDEGTEVFLKAIATAEPSVVVATQTLERLLDLHRQFAASDYAALLDRAGLVRAGESPALATDPAGGDCIEVLRGVWQDVLGRPIANDDDFFDLGGDSLLALRVIARVGQTLDVDLPLDVFFTASVLRDMADHVENVRWASAAGPG